MGSQLQGEAVDLETVTGSSVDSGVAHGDALVALTDALIEGTDAALASAQEAVRAATGDAGLLDAVGVISNFVRMNRIADATGIPLDEMAVALTADVRAELEIDGWAEDDGP